jgi:hypothetical protein
MCLCINPPSSRVSGIETLFIYGTVMSSVSPSNAARRVDSIDFWRGIVLIAILCDHIPGNLIEKATPRNFALSDSAEAFVFLSGVSVALAHYGRAQRADWRGLLGRCFGRAFHVYGVHVGLTCVAVAIAAIGYYVSGAPGLIESDGRSFIFHQPLQAGLGVLLLTQQLGYFNILPLYVVLLLWAPVVLAMVRVSPWLALGASLAIYAVARIGGLALPSWPEPGTWFFNPLAWQLVFTLGIVACVLWRDRPIPKSPMLYWAAAAALIVAAFGVTDGFWELPGIRDGLFAHLDLFKADLGLGRLAHFVVLAYFVSQTRVAAVERTATGRELQRLGRYSLPIFALGSILSCVGQTVMQAATAQIPDWAAIIGLVYTLFGILGLFLFARYLERNKPALHASPYPQDPQSPFSARLLLGLRTRSRALFTKSGHSR